jgi:hypothetical protein
MVDNKKIVILVSSLVCFGLVAIAILVPASLGYVDYYEYALDQSKITRAVDTESVYGPGRYFIGLTHSFLKYQRDAHFEVLKGLSVFSAGNSDESIGLEFKVDVGFTFLLIEDEIGELHKELSKNYRSIIISRAKDAIKNEAVSVTFTQYFQDRKVVEKRFQDAIQKRWAQPPSLHCTLDQFHLGRIQIPPSVAIKQLEAQIQNERNGKEAFTQQAEVEREQTAVEVNSINLETEKVLRTARAEANLLRSKARSEADRTRALANINGTQALLEAASITNEDHLSAFGYIRMLKNRKNISSFRVSYLSPENVVRTSAVA